MQPVFYDLHMHSSLSPCASNDMTPNNLVNMAILKELDLIALTDHNSCKNCPAAMKVAKQNGLAFIPGMELTTAEEVHVICLFSSLDSAMSFDCYVHEKLADIENNPKIFGDQLIMDEQDKIIGHEKKLLVNATSIEISELPSLVTQHNGICFPAHIDRSSYSVLSNLGFIPPECNFHTLEVFEPHVFFAAGKNKELKENYNIVSNSDAHYLEHISEREHCIHLDTVDFEGLVKHLK